MKTSLGNLSLMTKPISHKWVSEYTCTRARTEASETPSHSHNNVFYALAVPKINGPLFFTEKTVPGILRLHILKLFLIIQLQQDTKAADILFQ
jgi:hypothetical protein